MNLQILGELLKPCQDFFWNFQSDHGFAERRRELERNEDWFRYPGAKGVEVRPVLGIASHVFS